VVATFWIVALQINDLRCRPPLNHEISAKPTRAANLAAFLASHAPEVWLAFSFSTPTTKERKSVNP
jgi:hypothetical protein